MSFIVYCIILRFRVAYFLDIMSSKYRLSKYSSYFNKRNPCFAYVSQSANLRKYTDGLLQYIYEKISEVHICDNLISILMESLKIAHKYELLYIKNLCEFRHKLGTLTLKLRKDR